MEVATRIELNNAIELRVLHVGKIPCTGIVKDTIYREIFIYILNNIYLCLNDKIKLKYLRTVYILN